MNFSSFRKEITSNNASVKELVNDIFAKIDHKDSEINSYICITKDNAITQAEKIDKLGLKGIYLDNYFPWNGITNVLVAQTLGFKVNNENILGTISNYENLDNYVQITSYVNLVERVGGKCNKAMKIFC